MESLYKQKVKQRFTRSLKDDIDITKKKFHSMILVHLMVCHLAILTMMREKMSYKTTTISFPSIALVAGSLETFIHQMRSFKKLS